MSHTIDPLAALSFRRADAGDVTEFVRLRDAAARWQRARGIQQWRPGELGPEHFRARLREGELWLATLGPTGPTVGAWELWWEDVAAWGEQPPVAGYVHRLVVDRQTAPPGAGRHLLAVAERRVLAHGRTLCRLDCLANNDRLRAYYEDAGYAVVGERAAKNGDGGRSYGVTLLEKRLTAP
ncbi:GNAT family N-acetyltransferase [Streptomyces buecherae]|uniref:GNAT family N-acetyltransferase n=1 Tax=Streptomyces buecherae TaxID=2763006 RepID=UPI001C26A229|nr:GNAT family N-acetyltransferase [Streptomyces buecherae]